MYFTDVCKTTRDGLMYIVSSLKTISATVQSTHLEN